MNRVQRARGMNQIMTGVFYLIAVFFFTLLIGFASYVIIKGFTGATPEMFAFARKGSIGNQLFNTIYLVFISLLFSIPLGVTAGIYLAMYAKKGFLTKFLRICIETLFASVHCCWIVWISGISCVFRTWKKSSRRSIISFHSGDPSYHNNDRGRDQWFAGTLPAGKSWTWSNKMAVHLSCVDPGVYPKNHDRCHPGSRKRIW